MNDDETNFKPLDPGRIHALDPLEVNYWCKQLNCTEDELLAAVGKVGDHVAAVKQALDASKHRG